MRKAFTAILRGAGWLAEMIFTVFFYVTIMPMMFLEDRSEIILAKLSKKYHLRPGFHRASFGDPVERMVRDHCGLAHYEEFTKEKPCAFPDCPETEVLARWRKRVEYPADISTVA